MPPLNVPLLRSSFAMVVERQPKVTRNFYSLLFERYPSVRKLFSPDRMLDQERMLAEALGAVLEHIEDASWLTDHLKALGAKHVDYGVSDEMYHWVGECLIAALAEAAGSEWSDELEAAWSYAFGVIAGLMLKGASRRRDTAVAQAGRP